MLNNLMQKMTKLEQQQEKKRENVQSDMNRAQQEYTQTTTEVSKMQQQISEIQTSAELLEQQVCVAQYIQIRYIHNSNILLCR
jgi:hypothetical protein